MAYAGLRPSEAAALCWRHIGKRTILVEQSADGSGGAKSTKTGSIRTVALLAPLAYDLAAWRTTGASEPDADAPIVPRADGTTFTATGYRYRRRHRFDPAVDRAGLPITRPYDLRHSYASLMIQAGYSPVEPAELGHAPTLTRDTYARACSASSCGGSGSIRRERSGRRGERVPVGTAGKT